MSEKGELENIELVSISEIPNILSVLPKRQAVLILGPPGVGKSSIIRQFAEQEAREMGRQFVEYSDAAAEAIISNPSMYYVFHDMRLSEYVESDFLGFPKVETLAVEQVAKVGGREGRAAVQTQVASYAPMKWALTFSQPGLAGLLFIDELTNVVKIELQSLAYKLVLDRMIGSIHVSDDVRIIGAGNTPKFSKIAELLPAPLASRFAIFYVEAPPVGDWIDYITKHRGQLHPAIAAFLRRSADHFMKHPEEPDTLFNFPNPRSWDMFNTALLNYIGELKRKLKQREGEDAQEDLDSPFALAKIADEGDLLVLAQAYVGPATAAQFVSFLMLGNYVPSYEEIAEDPSVIFKRAQQAGAETRDEREGELKRLGVIFYSLAYFAAEAARRDDVDGATKVYFYLDESKKELAAALRSFMPAEFFKKIAVTEKYGRRVVEESKGRFSKESIFGRRASRVAERA
jgi:MoxR-like ATPase